MTELTSLCGGGGGGRVDSLIGLSYSGPSEQVCRQSYPIYRTEKGDGLVSPRKLMVFFFPRKKEKMLG